MYELKIYGGVMCHENEELCKIWRGLDFSVQNWHEEFGRFWHEHSKISKIYTLMGYFLTKVYNIWVTKSTEELCLTALKINAKREGKLTCAF